MSWYPLIEKGQRSYKYAFLRASRAMLLRFGASLESHNIGKCWSTEPEYWKMSWYPHVLYYYLVLTIIDSRSDPKAAPRQAPGNPSGNPWAIQMGQIPGPELKVGAKPRGLPGGCWHLELTDALEKLFAHHME